MGKYLIKNKKAFVSKSTFVIGEDALVAAEAIEPEEVIFLYEDDATTQRTRTSIQVAPDKHIEPGDFGAYANHSCDPNTQVVANYDEENNHAEIVMIALRRIEKGEEVTFDYATTETMVTEKLHNKRCLCGSPTCRGKITGFNDLSLHDQLILISKNITANYLQISE